MEWTDEKTIKLDKVENELDRFVLDVVRILEKHTSYVIISGYVAILFGRNRASEDIDIFVEPFSDFNVFAEEVKENDFYFLNDDDPKGLVSLLNDGLAIRVARVGGFAPNAEIKYAKRDLDFYCLKNRLAVVLNGRKLFIAPLELSIAFKLFLSSEKDIEDARFLFKMFQDKLDTEELHSFTRKLKVEELCKKVLL